MRPGLVGSLLEFVYYFGWLRRVLAALAGFHGVLLLDFVVTEAFDDGLDRVVTDADRAAESLDISRSRLYDLLRKYGLRRERG